MKAKVRSPRIKNTTDIVEYYFRMQTCETGGTYPVARRALRLANVVVVLFEDLS